MPMGTAMYRLLSVCSLAFVSALLLSLSLSSSVFVRTDWIYWPNESGRCESGP